MPALALHSFSKAIEIPARLRNQPLGASQTSARLTALLDRFGIRVLGDLHGRKVADFTRERNCGPKTLYELDLLARRAQSRNGKVSNDGHRRGCDHASHIYSHSPIATVSEAAMGKMQEDAADFVIPESLWHLSFSELPVTRRLASVVRLIGARSLGDLNGHNPFELLQYKGCGWGRISEIQQLIERAVSGEFDVGRIEQPTPVAELLSLLEEGLAELPFRSRQFLLARVEGQMERGRRPFADPFCLSHAEIGRRYGLTRARVHKVFANSIYALKKLRGPRVPRLLEVIKWRCLSMICPLTPQLLEKWVKSAAHPWSCSKRRGYLGRFRLSMEAQVRLIAALDKGIPCWLETNDKPENIDHLVDQFDLALAQMVREAGGQISVAEAYRNLSEFTEGDSLGLKITNFLRMLRSAQLTTVEFKNVEAPIIRQRPSNAGVFLCDLPPQNGKPSTARKIHSNSPAIQFFRTKNGFCESHAVARS